LGAELSVKRGTVQLLPFLLANIAQKPLRLHKKITGVDIPVVLHHEILITAAPHSAAVVAAPGEKIDD
jgi:hypothetical protein